MKEVRPGIIMVRRTKKNKLEELKESVIAEKTAIEMDIQEKYARGEKAVHQLQDFAGSVSEYVDALKSRGIDKDYVRENAEQIRNIFFAVLELIENGHKGFDESQEDTKAKKEKE